MFTYPLTISPANTTFEALTIEKWFPKKKNFLKNPMKTGWKNPRSICKNFSRFIMVITAAYLSIELSKVLDKFVGLIGALFCAPLGMIMPTLCHLKLVAVTKEEKVNDIIIIGISLFVMVLCID
jgi:amino acid permease